MSVDLNKLKKLADTCRKAGITYFKNAEFEIEVSDHKPAPTRRRPRKASISSTTSVQDDIDVKDNLSEEELLFWSAGGPSPEGNAN